ncbi:MAG: MMPL family transporter [Verrucomicrobia bacterium]|nr:MMPL family transporter [Verrucomicrobiota bacterium]
MSRLRAFGLILIFIIVTGFGLSRITLNVDVLALLPQDLPEVQGVQIFYKHFSRPDELLITLEGEELESAAESLAAELEKHPELVDSVIWNLPLQSDPQAASELLAYLWFNAEPSQVKALKARLMPEPLAAELTEVIEELSTGFPNQDSYLRAYDPLGLVGGLPGGMQSAGMNPSSSVSAFASVDEGFRVLYVKVAGGKTMDYKQASLWLQEIQAVIGGWEEKAIKKHLVRALPKVAYTGEPAFVAEIGSAMEQDMSRSVSSTIILICLFFWILHRRLVPLFWLVIMLGVTFGLTLAIGSLVIGELSIMSVGFAAILIGLTIDYGVILYKEARLTPGDPVALRRLVGPSIMWAATTTAAVFFALQFSGFPGIAQLGVLVAIGVLVGSVVMLIFYSPVAARSAMGLSVREGEMALNPEVPEAGRRSPWVMRMSLLVPLASLVILAVSGLPRFAENFKPLQLRDSPSMKAMEEMEKRLVMGEDGAQSLVIVADSLSELPDKIKIARDKLNASVKEGALSSFVLPDALLPNLENQKANREVIAAIAVDQQRLADAIEKAGFNEEALVLTEHIITNWKFWLEQADGGTVEPGGTGSRWIMDRLLSIDKQGRCAVLGKVTLKNDLASIGEMTSALMAEGIYITGWDTLDPTINRLIKRDALRVFLPVGLILVAMLSFIFRDWRDLVLSLAALMFSLGALLAITSLLRIEWNAFSLSSIPILFGVGLDYSIHMIFALRRNQGNIQLIRQGISRAILFCGLSTAVGFGSLSLASNLGLASIGRICGLGVLIVMATTLTLLPHWWRRLRPEARSQVTGISETSK